MFPSPQWLKRSHCRILTAPLKRCSTLYTKCENALVLTPRGEPRSSILRTQHFANLAIDSGRILRCFVEQIEPLLVVLVEFRRERRVGKECRSRWSAYH